MKRAAESEKAGDFEAAKSFYERARQYAQKLGPREPARIEDALKRCAHESVRILLKATDKFLVREKARTRKLARLKRDKAVEEGDRLLRQKRRKEAEAVFRSVLEIEGYNNDARAQEGIARATGGLDAYRKRVAVAYEAALKHARAAYAGARGTNHEILWRQVKDAAERAVNSGHTDTAEATRLFLQAQNHMPVWIVSKTGKADSTTISDAIKRCPGGRRILVRPGVYSEGLVLDRRVHIVGDGKREDIVIESRSSDGVLMKTDDAVVSGLTLRCRAGEKKREIYAVNIRRGRLVLENCDITSDSLSCVGIHGASADPVIRKCTIHDGKECGVLVYDKGKGTVEDCEIYGNALAGVEITTEADPVIRKCRIHDGKSGGVYVHDNGKGTVEDCEIYANALTGVAIRTEADPVIRKCRIHDGKQAGVLVHDNGKGTVENCEIYGNAYGGVEIRTEADPVIRNCRIHDGKQTGVIVHGKGKGTVENCEIYANALTGVAIRTEADPVIRNCKINRNGYQAVWVHKGGRGTVENCDLTGNKLGAWDIEPGGGVQRSGNRE